MVAIDGSNPAEQIQNALERLRRNPSAPRGTRPCGLPRELE